MIGAYIAGPMRGQRAFGFAAFFAAEAWLQDSGEFDRIFNPARRDEENGFLARQWDLTGKEDLSIPVAYREIGATQWRGMDSLNEGGKRFVLGAPAVYETYTFDLETAMKEDLDFIRSDECTHIVMLPGWGASAGARAELELAESLGREVSYLWPSGEEGFSWRAIPLAEDRAAFDLTKQSNPLPANLWIGLSGKARSGKDTIGDYLVERYGFKKVSFAAPLKSMALAIDPLVSCTPRLTLSEAVEDIGWERAKDEYPEVRRFLQRLGTEGVRNHLGDNVWTDLAKSEAERLGGRIVFTDCRFPNEVSMIEDSPCSLVLRVIRDTAPVSEHASESALDSLPMHRIDNTGTLDELKANVDRILFATSELV